MKKKKNNKNQSKVKNGKAVPQSGNPGDKTNGTSAYMAWLGLKQRQRDLDSLCKWLELAWK